MRDHSAKPEGGDGHGLDGVDLKRGGEVMGVIEEVPGLRLVSIPPGKALDLSEDLHGNYCLLIESGGLCGREIGWERGWWEGWEGASRSGEGACEEETQQQPVGLPTACTATLPNAGAVACTMPYSHLCPLLALLLPLLAAAGIIDCGYRAKVPLAHLSKLRHRQEVWLEGAALRAGGGGVGSGSVGDSEELAEKVRAWLAEDLQRRGLDVSSSESDDSDVVLERRDSLAQAETDVFTIGEWVGGGPGGRMPVCVRVCVHINVLYIIHGSELLASVQLCPAMQCILCCAARAPCRAGRDQLQVEGGGASPSLQPTINRMLTRMLASIERAKCVAHCKSHSDALHALPTLRPGVWVKGPPTPSPFNHPCSR